MIEGQLALAMFVVVCGILLLGFPVALTLGGTALGFATLGIVMGHFDASYLTALTGRIFGTMSRDAGCRASFYFNGSGPRTRKNR